MDDDDESMDVLEEAARAINLYHGGCAFISKDHHLLEVSVKLRDVMPTVRTVLELEEMEDAISTMEKDESSKALLDLVAVPRTILKAIARKVKIEKGPVIRRGLAIPIFEKDGGPPEEIVGQPVQAPKIDMKLMFANVASIHKTMMETMDPDVLKQAMEAPDLLTAVWGNKD